MDSEPRRGKGKAGLNLVLFAIGRDRKACLALAIRRLKKGACIVKADQYYPAFGEDALRPRPGAFNCASGRA
jgi:hypothetical protein